MTATATLERPVLAKLIVPRPDAVRMLQAHLDSGLDLKARKLQYQEDLDEARSIKLEWTQAVTDLLGQMFDNSSVADYFNDWVGKIFPEYAELGNFIEQFHEEMEQRVARLKSVVKRLEQAGENGSPVTVSDSDHAESAQDAQPAAKDAPASREAGSARPATPLVSNNAPVLLLSKGGDDSNAEQVRQFVRQLGISVVSGEQMAESLDRAGGVAFVVVTALPEGPALFHLGYCAGKVGTKKICMVHAPTSAPPDLQGIAHLALDGAGGWQLQLARQMRRAGVNVDLNRLC